MIAPTYPYNKLIEVTNQEFSDLFSGYTPGSFPKFTELARTATTHIMIASSPIDELVALPACNRSMTGKWTGCVAVSMPDVSGNNPLIKFAKGYGYDTVSDFITSYGLNH